MSYIEKDLPQLIVGLDSLGDTANYIHIMDAKEDTSYYCPCCKGLIKPRAYKKEIDYEKQAHFYHDKENNHCNDETFVHYICKNWLFEAGCKFIVNNIEYETDTIEIEKTLHTSFGDYRPDIIVTTTTGKIFYFEIKTTSRKNELYAPTWDELGNDVVEVNTREFINQKYKNNIPDFSLIYSNGECFIKSYTKTNYETVIAKRKLEWKRQDKLNYKIQWEKLDWFWRALVDYHENKISEIQVLEYFNTLEHEDKIWCYFATRKKSCVQLSELFKDNINQCFYDMIDSLKHENNDIIITLKHTSPLIYTADCRIEFQYLDYVLYENNTIKVRIGKGGLFPTDCDSEFKPIIENLLQKKLQAHTILQNIHRINTLPFVKEILPYSHWAATTYPLSHLDFNIIFEDYIHSKYIKEIIGTLRISSAGIGKRYIKEEYEKYRASALSYLTNEYHYAALKNNSEYQKIIRLLKDKCSLLENMSLEIRVSDNYNRITLLNGCTCLYSWECTNDFTGFEEKIYKKFNRLINRQQKQYFKIKEYIEVINNCKNKMWKATGFDGDNITLHLYEPESGIEIKSIRISLCNSYDIKKELTNSMSDLLELAENYLGIRFFWR